MNVHERSQKAGIHDRSSTIANETPPTLIIGKNNKNRATPAETQSIKVVPLAFTRETKYKKELNS